MNPVKKAVIPCAGLGTRFLPVTKVVPKELLAIGNKPAIHYVVEEAIASGVEEVILVLRRSKMLILDYFKPNATDPWPVEFKVAFQEEPLGLGHAVLCARKLVADEPFFVVLPDVLVQATIPACRQLLQACEDKWGVLLERVPREKLADYGIIAGQELGKGRYAMSGAVEKPQPKKAPSDLAMLGRYLFKPEIFDLIETSGPGALQELQLTDAINALAGAQPGVGVIVEGKVFDIGSPKGFAAASHFSNYRVP